MSKMALSFSRINTYDTCPRKFKAMYVTKTYPFQKDDDNPHFVRGKRIHKQLEDYVVEAISDSGDTDKVKLSDEAKNALPIVNSLLSSFPEVYPEQKICIDSGGKKIGWFDKEAFYRVIIDFIAIDRSRIAVAVDYKTGKIRDYEGFGGQLHLTAWILFMLFPDLEEVKSVYLYLDHKESVPITIYRSEFDKLDKYFRDKYEEINSDTKFEPKKNKYCYFCEIDESECVFKSPKRKELEV